MKDLILVGIQGSGKGTQARILAEKKGYQIFETGGALRAIAKESSPLGEKVKSITEAGDLVPNVIVMEIVKDFIDKADGEAPIIFDGIPRTEEQRQTLEALLCELKREFRVFEIRLTEEESFSRLMDRATKEGRADDNPESIKKRIANFHEHTQPLLAVWERDDKLDSIDGDQSVEAVTQSILELL